MAKKGVIFNPNAAGRIVKTVQHFESTYRDTPKAGTKKVIRSGGKCPPRNEEWILTIGGSPTAGTFDISLNILGDTETMQFSFDDTASEVETELETHTNIASGDVTVTGGPFPDTDIMIEFTGDLANHAIAKPPISFAALTGGSGVVVIISRWTPGYPNDGSVAP